MVVEQVAMTVNIGGFMKKTNKKKRESSTAECADRKEKAMNRSSSPFGSISTLCTSSTGSTVDGVSMDEDIKIPRDNDILLGRGRASWSHSGNKEFRSFVGMYLKKYTESKNRMEKTLTVDLIYNEIVKNGGRFLKLDASTNTWKQVGKNVAREKIAHTLRDAIGLRIKLTLDGDDSSEMRQFGDCSSSPSPASSTIKDRDLCNTTDTKTCSKETVDEIAQPLSGLIPEERQIRLGSDKLQVDKSVSSKKSGQSCSRQCSMHNEGHKLYSTLQHNESSHLQGQLKRHLGSLVTPQVDSNSEQTCLSKPASSAISCLDDELSTGLSSMSLETPKSGRSGSFSRSKGDLSHEKSALSRLSGILRPSKGSSRSTPCSTALKNFNASHHNENSFVHSQTPHRHSGLSSNQANVELSLGYECDISMSGMSHDWTRVSYFGDTGDIVSLEDFSIASNLSKNLPVHPSSEGNDFSMESTETSETEKEWRKTLLALRRS